MSTILFYINAINGGGAERVMVQLSSLFANSGARVVLVTSFRDKTFEYPLSPLVERISIENEEIKQNIFARNYTRIMALRRICKQVKPDVVISFMCEPNFRALIATIGLSIKNVVSVRNDPKKEYGGLIGRFVGKVLMPLADGCVFQTKEAELWFPEKLRKKSTIIHNAVKEDFFYAKRRPIANLIVTCARLVPQKNLFFLIDVMDEVVKKNEDVRLEIYGEGPLRPLLCDKIEYLGLKNHVHIMGATHNVKEVLTRASLFVLSSDYEGMPNSLMEAIVVGVPCISTDCPCGGPKKLLSDYPENLISIGDKASFASRIIQILKDSNSDKVMYPIVDELLPQNVHERWMNYINSIINTK